MTYSTTVLKVTPLEKAAYLAGGIGKDLIYWLITAYYMLFLSLSGKCSPAFILTLFIAGRIFDALNDPIMGLLSDFTKSRFGKFKPWIAAGTLFSALCTLALFYDPGLTAESYPIYAAVVYILWTLSYTMMDIPYWSMIPGFGAQPGLRERISCLARFGTLLGGQLIIWAGAYLLQEAHAQRTMPDFFSLALCAAAGFVLCELVLLIFVKDRSLCYKHSPLKLNKCLRLISKNDELLVIIGITILQQTAVGLFNAVFFSVIAADHSGSQGALTLSLAAGAGTQALVLLALPSLIRVFGRRRVFTASAVLMMAGYVVLCCMNLSGYELSGNVLTVSCVLSFAGSAICSALTTIMLADCVDYGEFKLGLRAEGLLFSAQTMSAKLGLAAAYLISGIAAAFTAFLPVPEKAAIAPQISMRLSLILAAVTAALMLALYLKSYRLHGVFFKTMLDTLEQIREPAVYHSNAAGKAQAQYSSAPYREEQMTGAAYRPGAGSRTNPAAERGLQKNLVLVRYALDKSCIIRPQALLPFENIVKELCSLVGMMRSTLQPNELCQAVLKRHAESSCAIAEGIAIAHARGAFMQRSAMGLAVMPEPLEELSCPDGTKCDLIFLIASPDDGVSHLTLLGRLSLMLNEPGFADKLRQAGSRHEIYDRLLQCSLKISCSKD